MTSTRRMVLLGAFAFGVAACTQTPNPSLPVSPTTAGPTPTSSVPTPTSSMPATVAFAPVVTDLERPVDIAWRPSDRLMFVAEQSGRVVPVRNGRAEPPVLDLHDAVSTGNEQGLLGLAFHPTRPLAYVDYTDTKGDTIIAEYPVDADGTFRVSSVRTVLTIDQPYPNHNGGNLTFGPDGYLYIGMGDGGAAFDPQRRALNPASLLGKILRIDPVIHGDRPYTVPADNPYRSTAGARPEIWSIGVRNPWRFSFDAATGDLWIADVGQNAWEEIDVARKADGGGRGVNFGWSAYEGTHRANADQPTTGAVPPIYEYPHGDDGCSISGGAVYRGADLPALDGWYVFSDYCSGHVRALLTTSGSAPTITALGTVSATSTVRAGPDGEVFVLSLDKGIVFRLAAA